MVFANDRLADNGSTTTPLTVGVEPLLKGIEFGGLIADKAFDSDRIVADLNERGAKVIISQHREGALHLIDFAHLSFRSQKRVSKN